jgi:hypothetical protein
MINFGMKIALLSLLAVALLGGGVLLWWPLRGL